MIDVIPIPRAQWVGSEMSAKAHRISFGEIMPGSRERIDFALLVVDSSTDTALGYITCKELDSETLFWEYGGAFPSAEKSIRAWRCLETALNYCFRLYPRIRTRVEAENVSYLKMAMTAGFRIIGFGVFKGQGMCELMIEREN